MKIIIALYGDHEFYPPTLNAINQLPKVFNQIYIVYRAQDNVSWNYPNNVTLISDKEFISSRKQESLPILKKIGLFRSYTSLLHKSIKKYNPDVILVYDPLALLSLGILNKFNKIKSIFWYHNHDVSDAKYLRKYSLSWFAAKMEKKLFPKLEIFSLPAQERKQYFPTNILKGRYFFIPNFPSKKFYLKFPKAIKSESEIRIIYQGSIGKGHGIEEIIDLLPAQINNKDVKLILIGVIRTEYKSYLQSKINSRGVNNLVEFINQKPYQEIPEITSKCHIGVSIFTKNDIMNKTIGTASNKIYEYIACGLPILYYEDEHFQKHLGKMSWAIPVKLEPKSLLAGIKYIDTNFEKLSNAARHAFLEELHFEKYFDPVLDYVSNIVDKN